MEMNNFYYTIDRLFDEKKPDEAESFMRDMLARAEDECDAGAIITVCNELGGYYRAVSRYSEGIELYEKALKSLKDMGLTGSEHYGTTLVNYATTYTMMGDIVKALNLYTEAAEVYAAVGLGGNYRLAALFNNMSMICQDLQDYPQAEEYLEKALYILKTLNDSESEIAIIYSNLANVYLATGKMAEAKVTVKKALDLFIGTSGDGDVHYAGAVCTLGDIYFSEKDYEKAAALFREAMSLTERDYGKDNLSYAVLCENLAICLKELIKAETECESKGVSDTLGKSAGKCNAPANAEIKKKYDADPSSNLDKFNSPVNITDMADEAKALEQLAADIKERIGL